MISSLTSCRCFRNLEPQIEGRIIWGENRVDYSLRVILLSERFEDFGVSWSEHRWFLWELWQQIYIHSNLEVIFSRCLSSHCFTFLYYICPLFAENPTGSFFRAKKRAWFWTQRWWGLIHTTWRNSPATRNGKPDVLGMTGPGANPSSFLDLCFFQVPKSETPGRSHRKTEDLVGETVLTSGGGW